MPRRSLDNSVLQQIKDKVDMMDVKKTSIVSEVLNVLKIIKPWWMEIDFTVTIQFYVAMQLLELLNS